MDSPLPSSFQAPSIWYAAVEVPHQKFFGKGMGPAAAVFAGCAKASASLRLEAPASERVEARNSRRVSEERNRFIWEWSLVSRELDHAKGKDAFQRDLGCVGTLTDINC